MLHSIAVATVQSFSIVGTKVIKGGRSSSQDGSGTAAVGLPFPLLLLILIRVDHIGFRVSNRNAGTVVTNCEGLLHFNTLNKPKYWSVDQDEQTGLRVSGAL